MIYFKELFFILAYFDIFIIRERDHEIAFNLLMKSLNIKMFKIFRLLLMRVPMQVIKDSMNSRRSKFLRQSDPALKSLTGTINIYLQYYES